MAGKNGREAYYLDQSKLKSGVKLPLFDSDGKATGDFILVRSRWSNEVKKAVEQAQRRIRMISWDDEVEPNVEENIALDAMVAMVAGWSFGGEFEENPPPEDIREFLERAPHITNRIDAMSGNNMLFFPDKRGNSSSGANKKSG